MNMTLNGPDETVTYLHHHLALCHRPGSCRCNRWGLGGNTPHAEFDFHELGPDTVSTREKMKKILMMSAAAIVTAGAASADVNLSGYGRFGLTYNDGVAAGTAQTQIDTRFRLNIDATMTSDVGVEFGGRVRLQYDDNSATSVVGTTTPVNTNGVVNTVSGTTGSGAQLSPGRPVCQVRWPAR
ncbi:porin [Loktanella sp. M215]|uniref:porin n=1 Tax=Loktanella sp. M215 TaxID=2675431 RepID=UPI0023513C93|nr:porin [Loktanella sp. M215]